MEGRIRQLESILEHSEIIEAPEPGVVGPGTIVTIVYDGDSDDDAERYLVGHIEERTDDLEVVSPTAPLGAALIGHRTGDTVAYETPDGRRAARPHPRGDGGLTDAPADSDGRRAGAVRRPRSSTRPRPAAPPLPPARDVELAAGTVGLREVAGPPGAPTVVLLHGWTASADLNFCTCFDAARRALPRPRVRPPRPRRRHPLAAPVPPRGLRRRRRRAARAPRSTARRSSSATRWAAPSPSSSGGATRTSCGRSCWPPRPPASRPATTTGCRSSGCAASAAWPGSRPPRPGRGCRTSCTSSARRRRGRRGPSTRPPPTTGG